MELFRQQLQSTTARIRVLHAIPNGPAVDVYSNGNLIAKNLNFSDITDYVDIAADTYEIEIFQANTTDKPLISQEVTIAKGAHYTFSAVVLGDSPMLFKLRDAGIPTSITSTYVRFINLSPNAPLLNLSLPNDVPYFEGVEYLETTGYYTTSPGVYNLKVSFAGAEALYKFIKNINFDNGKLYTIYIIGLVKGKPPVGYLLVTDTK